MNNLVKEQLKLCRKAQIPEFDDNTTKLIIPKGKRLEIQDVVVGNYYLIEVENYIINPFDGFDLHIKWNHNIVPKDKYMKCEILQVMGKMIKINSLGYNYLEDKDTNNVWEGWLPRKSFKIIKVLD